MLCLASPSGDTDEKSGVDRGVPPADSVECMGANRKAIDPGLLRRLYLDEAQSTVAIGARLGCAGQTILRRLRRRGSGSDREAPSRDGAPRASVSTGARRRPMPLV